MILGYNTVRNKNKLISELLNASDVGDCLREHLFLFLGQGSHRECFALNSNWVVKVSLENEPGSMQNITEIATYNIVSTDDRFSTIRKYFAKIHPGSTERFVIMQRIITPDFIYPGKLYFHLLNQIEKYDLIKKTQHNKVSLYNNLKGVLENTYYNKVFLEFLLLESLTGARIITDLSGYGNTKNLNKNHFKIVDYGYCDKLSRHL